VEWRGEFHSVYFNASTLDGKHKSQHFSFAWKSASTANHPFKLKKLLPQAKLVFFPFLKIQIWGKQWSNVSLGFFSSLISFLHLRLYDDFPVELLFNTFS
jgi:hypothetical protein